jgi:TonB family protein
MDVSDPLSRFENPAPSTSSAAGANTASGDHPSVSPISAAYAANSRGIGFFKLNMFPEAIVNFDEAIRARPDFAEAYLNRGAAYQVTGKYKEAIADYDKALSFKPGYALAISFKSDAEHKLAAGVEGLGPGVRPPVLMTNLEPKYTRAAIAAGVKGSVVLGCTINERGSATDIRVLKSPGYGLEDKAIDALKKARFHPAEKEGKTVSFALRIEIKFREP